MQAFASSVLGNPPRRRSITAPFGGPSSLSGLVLWLKADSLALADGTAVSLWQDYSGLSNNAIQATGANQPLLKTAILNGLPILRFDGVNDTLTIAATLITGGFSVFIVRKSAVSPSSAVALAMKVGTGIAAGHFLCFVSAGQEQWAFRGNAGPIWNWSVAPAGVWNIVDLQWDGAGFTAPNYRVFLNGSPQGITVGAHGGTGNTSDVSLSTNLWNGDIAEIVVYSRKITSTERSNVRNWLSAKWGITVEV